jgi:hypothetical protein
MIKDIFYLFFGKIFGPLRSFKFQGRQYRYFIHPYNATWRNERAVEIPIVWEIVKKNQGKNILELGNTLSHYFSVNHDILDKYEKAKMVINQDVVDFKPTHKYDLIISISTIEHIGWDESPRNPLKIFWAIENLKNCLASNGEIVITLPLGYNSEMDKLLKEGKIPFTKQYFLKRISRDNRWKEVSWEDICDAKYNFPFPSANGLVIGIIKKK